MATATGDTGRIPGALFSELSSPARARLDALLSDWCAELRVPPAAAASSSRAGSDFGPARAYRSECLAMAESALSQQRALI